MIRFSIDSPADGPGYILVAEAENQICRSDPLPDSRAIALQARELADAAAALIEPFATGTPGLDPELYRAFESLHDALDNLPTPP